MAIMTVFPGFFRVNKNVSIGNAFVSMVLYQWVVRKFLPELVQVAVVLESSLTERFCKLILVDFEVFAQCFQTWIEVS